MEDKFNMGGKSEETSAVGCLVMFLATPLLMVEKGWALTWLWHWFIAEPFCVQQIRLAHAIGLSLLASYLFYSISKSVKQDVGLAITQSALLPLFGFGFGWVIHQFM